MERPQGIPSIRYDMFEIIYRLCTYIEEMVIITKEIIVRMVTITIFVIITFLTIVNSHRGSEDRFFGPLTKIINNPFYH